MNRGILIKLIVVLLVAALVHSVFWFYKAGQVEKQITNYIAENNSYVLAGQVKVSGFPFWQKVTINDLKFSLPNPAFSKYQVVVKQLEANSGIFGNEFIADIIGSVQLQDPEGNMSTIEFNQKPQINFVIADSMVAKISYQDSGYRVLDSAKNIVYSAASTMVNVESKVDGNDQVTGNLKVNVHEMIGFDIIDAYKNSSEKRIIDGIKTGEITIGNNSQATALIKTEVAAPATPGATTIVSAMSLENKMMASPNVATPAAAVPAPVVNAPANPAVAAPAPIVPGLPVIAPTAAPAPVAAVAPVNPAVPTANNPAAVAAPAPTVPGLPVIAPAPGGNPAEAVAAAQQAVNAAVAAASGDQMLSTIVSSVPDKNNLMLDIDFTLTPNRSDQQSSTPFDPSQIQELNVQYNKSIKINNLELSNSMYKIVIAGQVNTFIDDNMPSGSVTIKVDNMVNLVNHIVTRFNEMAKKDEVVEQAQASADAVVAPQVNVNVGQDAYQGFLKKVALGLPEIAKELASKNQNTKDDMAVFEMRRDKNLEYIINETPSREVVGKF